jgi:hypothetical protein
LDRQPPITPEVNPEALRREIAELRQLSACAAAAGDVNSRFAKAIFDQLIARLEGQLATAVVTS